MVKACVCMSAVCSVGCWKCETKNALREESVSAKESGFYSLRALGPGAVNTGVLPLSKESETGNSVPVRGMNLNVLLALLHKVIHHLSQSCSQS